MKTVQPLTVFSKIETLPFARVSQGMLIPVRRHLLDFYFGAFSFWSLKRLRADMYHSFTDRGRS